MSGPVTNNGLITTVPSSATILVNPDGTGSEQFLQFLRSFKRVAAQSDPATIAALQAAVAALQTAVAALQAQQAFLLETEAGP